MRRQTQSQESRSAIPYSWWGQNVEEVRKGFIKDVIFQLSPKDLNYQVASFQNTENWAIVKENGFHIYFPVWWIDTDGRES